MAKKPAISVLMTFYDNGKAEPRKYLEESLHSILNQSFRDFEIVLVVSGKRDFARRLARKSRKIRLFFFKQKVVLADQPELERRKGIVRGRNECIRNARGDIVAFADADDICLPERLERQYRFMKTNRDIGAIGSSLIHIDNGGGRICVRGARENDMDIRRGLLSFCSLYQTTMMVRKELLLKAGGYRTTRFAEDYDLLVRLARLTKFHNIV
ncbi:MAG: glycosyltransferase, partial [Candidatus Micrarchaeota archaeon]|nr:glycosyltransferase [Candidatus Micrarchaeota archaeon]